MSMNSNAILDRVEIIFYSSITAFMSGINRVRIHLEHLVNVPFQPSSNESTNPTQINEEAPENSIISIWTYFSQALVPLIIWIILGFAAGFLIGMIKSG